jgi:hypothetical protein
MTPSRVFLVPGLVLALSCSTKPRVIFTTVERGQVAVLAEIAATPDERARGLMFRERLSDGEGMLFLFSTEQKLTFWMKDTPLSLDMIFISSDMAVAGVIEEAIPFSIESLSIASPSRYVLEVQGGFAKRNGISVGTPVKFERIDLSMTR